MDTVVVCQLAILNDFPTKQEEEKSSMESGTNGSTSQKKKK